MAPFGCLVGQSSQFKARVHFRDLKPQGNQETRREMTCQASNRPSNCDSASISVFISGKRKSNAIFPFSFQQVFLADPKFLGPPPLTRRSVSNPTADRNQILFTTRFLCMKRRHAAAKENLSPRRTHLCRRAPPAANVPAVGLKNEAPCIKCVVVAFIPELL